MGRRGAGRRRFRAGLSGVFRQLLSDLELRTERGTRGGALLSPGALPRRKRDFPLRKRKVKVEGKTLQTPAVVSSRAPGNTRRGNGLKDSFAILHGHV